jgi:hypothetical protein
VLSFATHAVEASLSRKSDFHSTRPTHMAVAPIAPENAQATHGAGPDSVGVTAGAVARPRMLEVWLELNVAAACLFE